MSRTKVTDDEIVALLNHGNSTAEIARHLHVGPNRIAKVRRELRGDPAPVDTVGDTDDVDDAPETVAVSAEYLRALEAVVYLVQQNQRLHLAVTHG